MVSHQKKILVCVSAFTVSLVLPTLVLASGGGFVPLTNDANFEAIFGQKAGTDAKDLTSFINSAFKVILSIGAILAVLRIAWAGYQYMTSDAWGEKSNAKEILGDVVIGLLLLMSVYLILYQINPQITDLKINAVSTEQSPTGLLKLASARYRTRAIQIRTVDDFMQRIL